MLIILQDDNTLPTTEEDTLDATPSPSVPKKRKTAKDDRSQMLQKAYEVMETMAKRTADEQPTTTDTFDVFGSMVASTLREYDGKMPQLRHKLQMDIQKSIFEAQTEFYRIQFEGPVSTASTPAAEHTE